MLWAGGMPLLAPRARAFSARLEGAGRSLPRGCGAEGAPASSTGLRWLNSWEATRPPQGSLSPEKI